MGFSSSMLSGNDEVELQRVCVCVCVRARELYIKSLRSRQWVC